MDSDYIYSPHLSPTLVLSLRTETHIIAVFGFRRNGSESRGEKKRMRKKTTPPPLKKKGEKGKR